MKYSDAEKSPLFSKKRREMNRMSSNLSAASVTSLDEELFRYPLRWVFTVCAVIFATLCGAVSLTIWQFHTVDEFILSGSIASAGCCTIIIVAHSQCRILRRHPNSLIMYKSIIDLLLSGLYIFQYAFTSKSHLFAPVAAAWIGGATQGLSLSSESWFCAVSVDLLLSITNPFASFSYNLKIYRRCSMFLGITSSIAYALFESKIHPERFEPKNSVEKFFWMRVTSSEIWYFYYGWVVAFIAVAIFASVYMNWRLRKGLQETFETRRRVLFNIQIANMSYVVWSLTMLILFLFIGFRDRHLHSYLSKLFCFIHSGRGIVNFTIWCAINQRDLKRTWYLTESENRMFFHTNANDYMKPQLNVALRKQVIEVARQGILEAVEYYNRKKRNIHVNPSFNLDWNSMGVRTEEGTKRVKLPGRINQMDHSMEEMHFYDYQPQVFASIRALFGVNEQEYMQSFRLTANGRLTEGRSGAFVFNSYDKKYIVKSMTKEERKFLLSILPAYFHYLKWNKKTLLPIFFGCHAMKLYGKTFAFIVMGNILSTKETVHRKYDIKGSWVDRNAPGCIIGEQYLCANCNQEFSFGRDESCPSPAGEHYPNLTLKDNDLKKKIKIDYSIRELLVKQISRDSRFLSGLGITDYSLLIGIHYSNFRIFSANNDTPPDSTYSTRECDRMSRSSVSSDRSLNAQIQLFDPRNCAQQSTQENSSSTSPKELCSSPPLQPAALKSPSCSFLHKYRANEVSGPSLYCIGMVDILQEWTVKKQLERWYKVFVLRKSSIGISAMSPKPYAARFRRKIVQILSSPNDRQRQLKSAQSIEEVIVSVDSELVKEEPGIDRF